MTKLLDWLFSYDVVGGYRILTEWPGWLCWLFTQHRVELKWADYLNDVKGERCRCNSVQILT